MLYNIINCQVSVKVNYETIIQPTIKFNGYENIPESQKEEIRRQLKQQYEKPNKFVLFYNDGSSYFVNDPTVVLPERIQKTEYLRIKDKKGFYSLNDFIVEEFYGYYPQDNIQIEYTDETQIIENYKCKLAIYKSGNTKSKVWYTEDIPISAGPYIYYKVPGLVLKVENPNLLCYAVGISKEFDKKDLRKMDPNLKIYEEEELKQKKIEGNEKMSEYKRKNAEHMMNDMKSK